MEFIVDIVRKLRYNIRKLRILEACLVIFISAYEVV